MENKGSEMSSEVQHITTRVLHGAKQQRCKIAVVLVCSKP